MDGVRALRRQDGQMGSSGRREGRWEDTCGYRSHGKNEEDCGDILASWLFVKPKSRRKGKELGIVTEFSMWLVSVDAGLVGSASSRSLESRFYASPTCSNTSWDLPHPSTFLFLLKSPGCLSLHPPLSKHLEGKDCICHVNQSHSRCLLGVGTQDICLINY